MSQSQKQQLRLSHGFFSIFFDSSCGEYKCPTTDGDFVNVFDTEAAANASFIHPVLEVAKEYTGGCQIFLRDIEGGEPRKFVLLSNDMADLAWQLKAGDRVQLQKYYKSGVRSTKGGNTIKMMTRFESSILPINAFPSVNVTPPKPLTRSVYTQTDPVSNAFFQNLLEERIKLKGNKIKICPQTSFLLNRIRAYFEEFFSFPLNQIYHGRKLPDIYLILSKITGFNRPTIQTHYKKYGKGDQIPICSDAQRVQDGTEDAENSSNEDKSEEAEAMSESEDSDYSEQATTKAKKRKASKKIKRKGKGKIKTKQNPTNLNVIADAAGPPLERYTFEMNPDGLGNQFLINGHDYYGNDDASTSQVKTEPEESAYPHGQNGVKQESVEEEGEKLSEFAPNEILNNLVVQRLANEGAQKTQKRKKMATNASSYGKRFKS